jgi:ClpP class serine protease
MDDEEDDEEGPGYEVQDAVATICVEGALMDRACWWWDGYDALQARVERAHADPAVKALLFDLDSPGGMVAGLFDCMRGLRAAKAKSGKRCVAWVGSGAYSACYGIASTCDEIVVSDTAGVGSVGVITSLTSYAKMLEENGIDVRVVSSGEEKTDGHGALPISKAAEGFFPKGCLSQKQWHPCEMSDGVPDARSEGPRDVDGQLIHITHAVTRLSAMRHGREICP